MKTSNFDFYLPQELIAQKPLKRRDAARLLQVSSSGQFHDKRIADLPNLLDKDDLLIVNNTKVIPAQMNGKIAGRETKIQINLHKFEADRIWLAFARPAKKLRRNDYIIFSPTLSGQIIDKLENGQIAIKFNIGNTEFAEILKKLGIMPLPPYIKRVNRNAISENFDYQTTFASIEGAVACPTAGLHFTPELIAALQKKKILIAPVTLHVGAGTFLPIKTEDIEHHHMHSEWGEITSNSAELINKTRERGGKIIAVGTTVLRILETAAELDGRIPTFKGNTNIFITPGYQFKTTDYLLTNFHLPKSTLFILVSAYCGLARIRDAYRYAIERNFRFFTFGDATLLQLNKNIKAYDE